MLKLLSLGLVTVSAGMVMQAWVGYGLDERIGLDVLFLQRGRLPPPPEVAVVAIDKLSADRLGLPNSPDRWPRSLHATLIDRLVDAGARVIVFDLFFKTSRAEDEVLAAAMTRAGNVILVGFLKREIVAEDLSDVSAPYLNIEQLLLPVPPIEGAAVAIAPFPLPKVPAKVSWFNTFRASAGDMPTLPAMALQFYTLGVYDEVYAQLTALGVASGDLPAQATVIAAEAELSDVVARLRLLFQRQPQLAEGLSGQLARVAPANRAGQLKAMIELYRGDNLRYLNFYGPPRSLTTLPYWRVLENDGLPDLRDRAVFVGFSELLQPEQRDGFYTAFSQKSGLDISGVEIAATAFANLLRGESIVVPWHVGIIILFGLLVAVCTAGPSAWGIVIAGVAFCAVYVGLGFYAFQSWHVWLPLFVPVVIQTPLAMLAALVWRYLQTNRERQRIRQAFGYYLPASAVEQLVKDAGRVQASARRMYGVVLATDAEQYTRLSEAMAPEALSDMLNRYYGVLFEPVRRRGGVVSDVIGDAMLAMWSSVQPLARHRSEACAAALDIIQGVDHNRSSSTPAALPTRIGLHAGDVMIGNVGAIDHFEYRAVGDIVNTSTRIEGLNKQLGTRIIASRQVIDGIEGIVFRELGAFRLAGKQRPLDLFEVVCFGDDLEASTASLLEAFAAGLGAYRARMWDDAARRFSRILDAYPEDGPSGFYKALCLSLVESPPPEPWNATVVVQKK